MERFTVSLDGELLDQFDRYMAKHGYANRSEAVRDILRDKLEGERLEGNETGRCVACLSYIYNHHERELSRRITDAQHASHDIVRSTLHVHLDHDNCMEVAVLEGETGQVKKFADGVIAETGVRHGSLTAVPVETKVSGKHSYHQHDQAHGHSHSHGGDHGHTHSRPKT
jgi:CopG family transcriptional regulator, nickel-responsive regulator